MSDHPVEIERKYILRGMPTLPSDARSAEIWQGYLDTDESAGVLAYGRLRRQIDDDGTVHFTHTRKEGDGLVRTEIEMALSEAEFQAHWPRTRGCRLAKQRWSLDRSPLHWCVDRFHDVDVIVAEVEMPSPDTPIVVPDWLEPWIERDVTEDPAFSNYSLVQQIPQSRWEDVDSLS